MGQLSAIVIKVGHFEQNCTILFDQNTLEGIIIDPGDEASRILKIIQLKKIYISAIWLTHGHIDHVGAAMKIKEELDIQIIGPHLSDKMMLTNLEWQARYFGVPGNFQSCTVDRFVSDKEILSFSNHNFEVLHCPGHTPGHVVFYSAADKYIHTGDVLFRHSIGATHFPEGDYNLLIDSIKKKLLPLPDETIFLCGHGSGSSLGEEKRNNPFLRN